MKKCLNCGEEINEKHALISARDENGMCYVLCEHCKYVMRAQVSKTTGKIHQLSRTPETNCEEEIGKCRKLFKAVGIYLGGSVTKEDKTENIEEDSSNNLKSIQELKAKVEEQEAKELEKEASMGILPKELLEKLSLLTGLPVDELIKYGSVKLVKVKKSDLDKMEDLDDEEDCLDEDCEDCPNKADCFEEDEALPKFVIYRDIDTDKPRCVFGYDEEEVDHILSTLDETDTVKVFELVEREITKKTVHSLKK